MMGIAFEACVFSWRKPMLLRIAIDSVVLIHFAFILFVALGGLLVLRWPKVTWLHIPAAVWGALIEFFGWACPLTSFEVMLQKKIGRTGYSGGFVDAYVMPIVYPPGLTRSTQIALGVGVVALNCALYGWVILRQLRKKQNKA